MGIETTTLLEIITENWTKFLFGISDWELLYISAIAYFWIMWGIKFILSCFYKPWHNDYTDATTVIIPTYKEDKEILAESVNRVLAHSEDVVTEVIIVTDEREPDITQWCREQWNISRVRVVEAPIGKRQAVRLGIESATTDLVVIVESDTFATPGSIDELIKPFIDKRVGGIVGDQLIYDPYDSVVNLFNNWVELIKYRFSVPALSLFGQVTVLGGRCVAFRREAVLPLMPSLVDEEFFGRQCVSGDDGRLTSLLMQAGWRSVYQSSAIFLTVSPPTFRTLAKQRLRWFRNSCRRTIRALAGFREKYLPHANRFWVWKRPLAALQMITIWTNSIVMGVLLFGITGSIAAGDWNFTGSWPVDIFIRLVIILGIGMSIRRFIRIYPAIRETKKMYWIYLLVFPWYLILMWFVRLYAFATMNRQGWVTRVGSGAGGFGPVTETASSRVTAVEQVKEHKLHLKEI